MKKLWIRILVISLIAILIPVIFIIMIYTGAFGILQNEDELLRYKGAAASVVLSREGELIGRIFIENRTNISYNQIPPGLIDALISAEDVRFYKHKGIDSRSLFRVLFKTIMLNEHSSGGGSTITQQLAKNMFGRRNTGLFAIFINKIKESILAHRLEKVFTKEEILTLYLNTVSFGENIFSIETASQRYFSKKVEQLNIEESAILVGMLKANNLYNPRLHPENAVKRRNLILSQMVKYKYLKQAVADSLSKLPLILNYSNIETEGPADYFLYQVKNGVKQILQNINLANEKKWNVEEDGLIITTTLNLALQNYVNSSFHDHLSIMQKRLNQQYETKSGRIYIEKLAESELAGQRNGSTSDSISVRDSLIHSLTLLHAGFMAMNPVTGAVRAWAGGIDFRTQPYDQILARRQMGSVFKPVLYSAALEQGIKPCYYLDNDSIVIADFKDWSPENFDHSYGGKYSLTGALVHSMNVPTFNLFLKVGFSSLDSLWRKMGFAFPLTDNPSLAMGTAEANIEEVAVAYSAFPNGGFKVSPQTIVSIKSSQGELIWENDFHEDTVSIFSRRTSQLMSAILQKAAREGTGSALGSVYGVKFTMAAKTGTSQDYADAWFAAFNPEIVMVSRVGASLPSIHFNNSSNGSGSALALPLVALTLKKIETDPELMKQLNTPFPRLDPELEMELNCPDYREKGVFENIINIFKKEKITYEKQTSKPEKKNKSFFNRIFGNRKKVQAPR